MYSIVYTYTGILSLMRKNIEYVLHIALHIDSYNNSTMRTVEISSWLSLNHSQARYFESWHNFNIILNIN
jgi:hypothetical protein